MNVGIAADGHSIRMPRYCQIHGFYEIRLHQIIIVKQTEMARCNFLNAQIEMLKSIEARRSSDILNMWEMRFRHLFNVIVRRVVGNHQLVCCA